MCLLAAILVATIGVQLAAPLATSRFIDGRLRRGAGRLVALALLTMALALLGQGVSVAETFVAEKL